MENTRQSLMQLAQEAQKFAPVLAILAFIIVGATFIIGTKEMKQGAKGDIYYIIGGVALVVGAVSIGTWAVGIFTF